MELPHIISDETPFCSCGCGNRVRLACHHYILGHNNTGLSPSVETRNRISVSNSGRVLSNDARMKISQARTGKPVSDVTRRKISESSKGRIYSEETRCRMSKAKMGCVASSEAREKMRVSHLGKRMSEETKRRMSVGKMGHSVSAQTRRKIGMATASRVPGMKGKRHSIDTRRRMRLAAIDHISMQSFGGLPMVPRIGKTEMKVLDTLQVASGVVIDRQYPVGGFFLDGYIKDVNLAVEFDEREHRYKKARDEFRRSEIRRELGCDFFIVDDRDWREPDSVTDRFVHMIRDRSFKSFEDGVAVYNIR
jgi:very-short-patch-repair endonuclease